MPTGRVNGRATGKMVGTSRKDNSRKPRTYGRGR